MNLRDAYTIIGNELKKATDNGTNIVDISLIQEAFKKIDNYACLGQISKIKKLLQQEDLKLFDEYDTEDFGTTRVIDTLTNGKS